MNATIQVVSCGDDQAGGGLYNVCIGLSVTSNISTRGADPESHGLTC